MIFLFVENFKIFYQLVFIFVRYVAFQTFISSMLNQSFYTLGRHDNGFEVAGFFLLLFPLAFLL